MAHNKFLWVLALSAGVLSLASCDEDTTPSSTDSRNEEIYAIYESYRANGGGQSYEEWLASIKGEKGDKGDKGDKGEKGDTGSQGEKGDAGDKGEAGVSVLTGEGKPADTLGNDGDSYVDTENFDYYVKADGKWSLKGNLKGLDGKNGSDGDKGDQGEKGDAGTTPHIGTNGNWWIGGTDTGVKAEGSDGTDGKTPFIGENGNWWIGNADTGVKAKGSDGDKGEAGVSVLTGEGKPADTLGNDGDSYIDTKTYDFYVKADGEWSLKDNLKGNDGANGDTAWSNTILPSEHGYVVPSTGSALTGSEVTFTAVPEEGYYVKSIYLNGEEGTLEGNDVSAKMKDGGYVVKAEFKPIPFKVGSNYYMTLAEAYDAFDMNSAKSDEDIPTLRDDIVLENGFTIAKPFALMMDEHTITTEVNDILVSSGGGFYLANGTIKGGDNVVGLRIEDKTTVSAYNVAIKGRTLLHTQNAKGDGSTSLYFNQCSFSGRHYGFSTSDHVSITSADTFGSMYFDGCEFVADDSSLGDNAHGDETAFSVSVPIEVNISNSSFTASRQALVVRNGNVNVQTSKFNYDGAYDGADDGYFLNGNYGLGNQVATAMISVGDSGTGEDYPGNAELYFGDGNEFYFTAQDDTNHKMLYLNSNNLEGRSTIVNLTKNDQNTLDSGIVIYEGAENVKLTVNGVDKTSSYKSSSTPAGK